MGLLLQLVFFAVAAAGVWLCGRTLLEIDRRYRDGPLSMTPIPSQTVGIRAPTPVVVADKASATASAPVPPPREPEPAALVA